MNDSEDVKCLWGNDSNKSILLTRFPLSSLYFVFISLLLFSLGSWRSTFEYASPLRWNAIIFQIRKSWWIHLFSFVFILLWRLFGFTWVAPKAAGFLVEFEFFSHIKREIFFSICIMYAYILIIQLLNLNESWEENGNKFEGIKEKVWRIFKTVNERSISFVPFFHFLQCISVECEGFSPLTRGFCGLTVNVVTTR